MIDNPLHDFGVFWSSVAAKWSGVCTGRSRRRRRRQRHVDDQLETAHEQLIYSKSQFRFKYTPKSKQST